MKKLLCLLTLCSHVFLIQAQNTTLLEKTEPEFPVDLSPYCNEELKKLDNINNLVQQGYRQFSRGHIQSTVNKIQFYFFHYNSKIEEIRALAPDLFKNRKQLKALYDAALPIFVEQFKRMTSKEQQAYIDELQKGIAYIKSFDPEKEKADLERMTKERKRFDDEKGILNAFIYRRLVNDGISKKEGLYWLKRMKKDLSPHRSKTTKAEDEYFLQPIDWKNKNIVKGKIFATDRVAIFEKKGDNYQLIPIDEEFYYYQKGSSFESGASWAVLGTAEAKYKLYLFREGKAPLTLKESMTKSEIQNLQFVEFPGQDAWGVGIYSKGITGLYAINKEGKLEKNTISEEIEKIPLDENHPKARLFLFEFKSGDRKVLYLNKKIKELASASIQKIYRKRGNQEYWMLNKQNKLYYYSHNRRDLIEFGVKQPIKEIVFVDHTKTIVEYQNADRELFFLDKNRTIRTISLPDGLAIKDFKSAWAVGRNEYYYYITLENGLMGVIDKNGKLIFDPVYESIDKKYQERVFLKKEGKTGLADGDGNIIIEPKYQSLSTLQYNYDWRSTCYKFTLEKDGKIGLLDDSGKLIFKAAYADLEIFKFDKEDTDYYYLYKLEKDGPLGLMDEQGNVLLKPTYPKIRPIRIKPDDKRIYAYFYERDRKGLIDQKGKVIIPAKYRRIIQVKKGRDVEHYTIIKRPDLFLVVSEDNKTGVIDLNGRVKVPVEYASLEHVPSKQPLFIFQKTAEGKKGLVDLNGKVLLGAEYHSLRYNMKNDGTALFVYQKEAEENFGVMDKNGKEIHPEIFTSLKAVDWIRWKETTEKLSINLATLESDKDNIYLYSDKFERIFDSSLDALQQADTIVTFDPETFQEFLKVMYSPYYPFKMDTDYQFFQVKTKGKASLINFKGEVVLPPVWDQIVSDKSWYHSSNYFIVRDGEGWGLIDRSNKLMIPTDYEAITPCEEPLLGYYILKLKSGSYNFADSTGKLLLAKASPEVLTYRDIPLVFVSQKQADESIKYALYSKEGKALTDFEFSPRMDTVITYDPNTFEEIVNVILMGPILKGENKTFDPKTKTIRLLRAGKEVIYNFEGKELD
jgi:bifunctional DNA-binding transcriptional regulator/antitoxin component of YhaV-PrlF toxin-antitoxin module